MLTSEDMKKLHDAVVAGKLRPTGLPLDRTKLEALPKVKPPPMKGSSFESKGVDSPQGDGKRS